VIIIMSALFVWCVCVSALPSKKWVHVIFDGHAKPQNGDNNHIFYLTFTV
jgi:hypothetical protein